MRVVTWNVRGVCSQFKMQQLWEAILKNQWDILCAVEHKDHKTGLNFFCKGYTLYYEGLTPSDYSGVLMIVRDNYQPKVVIRDQSGRYIVVEILYEGQVVDSRSICTEYITTKSGVMECFICWKPWA